jgi:hypothetical protein
MRNSANRRSCSCCSDQSHRASAGSISSTWPSTSTFSYVALNGAGAVVIDTRSGAASSATSRSDAGLAVLLACVGGCPALGGWPHFLLMLPLLAAFLPVNDRSWSYGAYSSLASSSVSAGASGAVATSSATASATTAPQRALALCHVSFRRHRKTRCRRHSSGRACRQSVRLCSCRARDSLPARRRRDEDAIGGTAAAASAALVGLACACALHCQEGRCAASCSVQVSLRALRGPASQV